MLAVQVSGNPAVGGQAARRRAAGLAWALAGACLFKNFNIRENTRFQLRWETFNVFNNANFEGVSNALGAGNFGQVTSARDPRTMQLGAKLEF